MSGSSGYNTKIFRRQGGAEMVFSSGSTLQFDPGVTINGWPGHIDLSPNLFKGYELSSGETLASGSSAPTYFFYGQLGPDTTPVLNLTSSGDQSEYLSWVSANVDAVKMLPFAIPTDLSTAGGLTIELKGEVTGSATAADAAQGFDIRCWSGVGDTEMGATHPNFTTAPSWKGITLSSADLTTGMLNITLVPQTHAGRALRLYGARARYSRKTA
jgi:hypothetical protein